MYRNLLSATAAVIYLAGFDLMIHRGDTPWALVQLGLCVVSAAMVFA